MLDLPRLNLGAYSESCLARHCGVWAIDTEWFKTAWAMIRAGVPITLAASGSNSAIYAPTVLDTGVGIVPLIGPLMKGKSKYGGTDSRDARRALRAVSQDNDVKSVLLYIDSPGGTVAGTSELAADVAELAKDKPVRAYIEDLGASAAYWVASQANTITANSAAMVGSIGTMLVVEDSSKAAENAGVAVHVISSGKLKGVGVDGAPVTEEQLNYLEGQIYGLNKLFTSAVASGRGISVGDVSARWGDGRVMLADEAYSTGLVDNIASLDATLEAMGRADHSTRRQKMDKKIRNAMQEMNLT